MTQLVPAILAETATALEAQAEAVVGLADLVSFDVMDGQFVPRRTPRPAEFPKLPPGRSIFWHLMVHDPMTYLDECLNVPSTIVAVHAEALGAREAIERLAHEDVLSGLVLNPATSVSDVQDWIALVDLVQVMTVIPGAQGSEFLPGQLGKIPQLRALRENLLVAVDGGASRGTIEAVARYRLDYIIVGSALTQAKDPREEFRILSRLAAINS